MSPKNKKAMIQLSHSEISIRQQCKMFRLNRSTFTSKPVGGSEATTSMRCAIDRVFTQYPFFGSRQIMAYLRREDESIEAEAEKMAEFDEITSIKSIGTCSAAIFLLVIGNVNDFATDDKLTAYLGIVLKGRLIQYEGHAWTNHQTWQ